MSSSPRTLASIGLVRHSYRWPGGPEAQFSGTSSVTNIFEGKEVITNVTIFTTWLSSLLHKEDGQGLAEYALILALIAVIAIAALVFLGTQISTILSTIGANI